MNKLYVVSTPIGNLGDISNRAIKVLGDVGTILAEDTRHSSILLNEYNIKTKTVSLHKYNEKSRLEYVINILKTEDVALISDAGTPTICDPGQFLINDLIKNGVEIISVPGASAIPAALSISGEIYNDFAFIGFIEKTESKMMKQIYKNIGSDKIVFYESPKRINKTLGMLSSEFPNSEITIVREITKKFEEVIKGKTIDLVDRAIRGEIVCIFTPNNETSDDEFVKFMIEREIDNKTIVDIGVNFFGKRKNNIYNLIKKYEK